MEAGQKFYRTFVYLQGGEVVASVHEYTATGSAQGLVLYRRYDGTPDSFSADQVFDTRAAAEQNALERLRRDRDAAVAAYNRTIAKFETEAA